MSNFWDSELGEVTGSTSDAYTPVMGESLPNNTFALAKIKEIKWKPAPPNSQYGETEDYINIQWAITDGDFKGHIVFHKIKVLDSEPKKRFRALSLLKLMYQLGKIAAPSGQPDDNDLMGFVGMPAGIKIQETQPDGMDKTINYVSEVHAARDFKCVTGRKLEVKTLSTLTPSRLSQPRSESTDFNHPDNMSLMPEASGNYERSKGW